MKRSTLLGVAAALGLSAAPAAAQVKLTGAGATFPNVIYQNWMLTYNKANPSVQLNYQSIGSGGGIRQFSDKTVDFGASDAPMTDSAIAAIQGDVLHIPTVLGAVVVTYNLPGVTQQIKFTPAIIADIFLGKLTKWNDPAIVADNPGVTMPDKAIVVARRSDGSGTNAIFTDYLAKVSPAWKAKVGAGKSVKWPAGLGAKGNEGVTGLVKQTPGAIGYVELIYAIQNHISYGEVQNHDGKFLRASLETVTEAAAGATQAMPPDFRVSITNAPGANAYPISSFTWMLFYQSPKDKARAKVMVDFFRWALGDGQKYCSQLGYAPLPKEVVALELKALEKIRL